MNSNDIIYKITKARSGLDTIIVSSNGKEMPLHSRINPKRDSELFAGRFDPDRFDALIVLGVGLGYHLIPLSNYLDSYSQIILIDILSGLDTAIAGNRLASFLLKSERISFILGKSAGEVDELLSAMIDLDRIRGISVLEHPASMRIFDDYYTEIKNSIEKLIHRLAGNKATKKAFGALYLRNIVKNAALLDHFRPVQDLYGHLNDFPALIVASGPCLEKDIQRIRRFQDRFFIISADSSLPVLHKSGILPDFVISIDPQPYVYEHFLGLAPGSATALFSLSSHPAAVKKFGGYIFLNSHPLCQFAERVYGDSIGSVDSATGSVAGDAMDFCLKCGFAPIGLVGLDFSFSDYKTYSRGTAYQNRYSLYFQNRISTVEGFNCRYILGASGGLKYEGRYTRRSFLQYRQSIEELIKNRKFPAVYALNDCGIAISGVGLLGLDQFVEDKCGTAIDKKSITAAINSKSRFLVSEPLISALSSLLDDSLFDEILEASLGSGANEKVKEKYRTLIASLKRI